MMKILATVCLLTLISVHLSLAQQLYDFQSDKYDWLNEIPSYAPSKEEQPYPSIYIYKKIFIEFKFDDKNRLRKYLTRHDLKYINDEKSVEENNKLYIPIEEEQALVQLKTRVFQKSKKVFEAGVKDMITINEDKRDYKLLAIKALSIGCILETIHTMEVQPTLYDDLYLQGGAYLKVQNVHIICPKRMVFKNKTYNYQTSAIDTVIGDRRFVSVLIKNIVPVEDEKYGFTDASRVRMEYNFSENTETNYKGLRWGDMGRNYFEYMYRGYETSVKDVNKIIKSVNPGQYSSIDEKIMAIESYLKSNIQIKKELPGATSVSDVIKKKMCNESDFIQIMAWCFKSADIRLELVLTCAKELKKFDPDFESSSYLKDVLFYFPHSKRFISPEQIATRYGALPVGYVGQQGIFIKPLNVGGISSGVTYIDTIPLNNAEDSENIEDYTVSFQPGLETVEINYKRMFEGSADFGIRAALFYSDEKSKNEFLEKYIKGDVTPSDISEIKTENINLSDYQQWQKPLIISAKLKTGYFCEKADDKILFKIGEIIGRQVEMYQEKPRQQDIELEFAHGYDRSIKINIPTGYQLKGLDKLKMNMTYNDTDGSKMYCFVSDYKIADNVLVVSCKEYYYKTFYLKSNMPTFTKVINAAADFNKISILIERR